MQEANAISFLPERQPRALTFITANAPTKKAGMYAGLPSFNDPVPWRPLAVLSHFFGCGSATVSIARRVDKRVGGTGHAIEGIVAIAVIAHAVIVTGNGGHVVVGVVGERGARGNR